MSAAGRGDWRLRVVTLWPREVLGPIAVGLRYREREALGELLCRRLGRGRPVILASGERRSAKEDEGDVAAALHGGRYCTRASGDFTS